MDGADAVIQLMKIRIQRLETALRDAISTYGPAPEIVVTAERQEAWKAALNDALCHPAGGDGGAQKGLSK